MQEPDDVVLVAVADGVAGHALVQGRLDAVVEAVVQIQADHIRTGHHDLAGAAVGKIEDVVEIGQLASVDIAVFIAFLHQNADFFFVMSFFRLAGSLYAHAAQRPVGDMVQRPDGRVHELVKQNQRARYEQHHGFGLLNRQGFRHQLAQYDVQGRNQGKADDKGQRVLQLYGHLEKMKHRRQHLGHGRLADPAQPQGGQGNAQLRHRQVGVQMLRHRAGVYGALIPFLKQRIDSRRAHLDDGKLRRYEETVQHD